NEAYKQDKLHRSFVEGFIKLLYPIAPHLCEEIWHKLGHTSSITYAEWPQCDEAKMVEDEVEIAIQGLGKVRAKLKVPVDASKDRLETLALENDKVRPWLKGKTIRKVIVVPGKLVNIVAN